MNLIEVKNLSVSYKSQKKETLALCDVNASFRYGDYVSIVGKNGAGKSTLIKSILGLVKIKRGKIIFNKLKKCEISYVPQFNNIFATLPATVKEIVFTGILKPGLFNFFSSKQEKIKALKYLDLLNINSILERSIPELSGGQVKKVLLARALCSNPKVLILDEPCASLDEHSSCKFCEILKKLNKINNITIIIVTHNTKYAQQISSKILFLEEGKIKSIGHNN